MSSSGTAAPNRLFAIPSCPNNPSEPAADISTGSVSSLDSNQEQALLELEAELCEVFGAPSNHRTTCSPRRPSQPLAHQEPGQPGESDPEYIGKELQRELAAAVARQKGVQSSQSVPAQGPMGLEEELTAALQRQKKAGSGGGGVFLCPTADESAASLVGFQQHGDRHPSAAASSINTRLPPPSMLFGLPPANELGDLEIAPTFSDSSLVELYLQLVGSTSHIPETRNDPISSQSALTSSLPRGNPRSDHRFSYQRLSDAPAAGEPQRSHTVSSSQKNR